MAVQADLRLRIAIRERSQQFVSTRALGLSVEAIIKFLALGVRQFPQVDSLLPIAPPGRREISGA